MKKQILFFSALLIVALFTACEQDSLISTDVSEGIIAEQSLENHPELPSVPMTLIDSEETAVEFRACSSFPNGGGGHTKVGSDPAGGPLGFYSGKYRFWGRNNSFPPANVIANYYIEVQQQKNNGTWEKKSGMPFWGQHTFVWNDPTTYRSTNGFNRNLRYFVGINKPGCSNWDWVVTGKRITLN